MSIDFRGSLKLEKGWKKEHNLMKFTLEKAPYQVVPVNWGGT